MTREGVDETKECVWEVQSSSRALGSAMAPAARLSRSGAASSIHGLASRLCTRCCVCAWGLLPAEIRARVHLARRPAAPAGCTALIDRRRSRSRRFFLPRARVLVERCIVPLLRQSASPPIRRQKLYHGLTLPPNAPPATLSAHYAPNRSVTTAMHLQ